MSESVQDVYGIPNYTGVHQCRQGKRGGGVSIFVKDTVQFKERIDLALSNDCIECVFVEIDGKTVGIQKMSLWVLFTDHQILT